MCTPDGFTLQAARHLHANDREGLAFLIRYNLRPPIALSRLTELPSGKILLTFKRPLADGTAALELTPVALLRRLASLVPPPGAHDLSYFGIFSSHDSHRRLFVRPRCRCKDPDHCQAHACLDAHDDEDPAALPQDPDALLADVAPEERYIRWADLMRKVRGLEVLDCPCGGKRKVVGLVTNPEEIRQTLKRLGLPLAPLEFSKARKPAQRAALHRHSDFGACPERSRGGLDPPPPD